MSQEKIADIRKSHETTLFRKIQTKFHLLKVRQKIGYIAARRGMTIVELLLKAIVRTHTDLVDSGYVVLD